MCIVQVQYAPKVIVSVVNGALESGQIPNGNTIDVLCAVDANPDVVTYRWYLNDEQVPDQTGRMLVSKNNIENRNKSHSITKYFFFFPQNLYNVTRDYQNHILKCVAQNEIGVSSDSETFDIICKIHIHFVDAFAN